MSKEVGYREITCSSESKGVNLNFFRMHLGVDKRTPASLTSEISELMSFVKKSISILTRIKRH